MMRYSFSMPHARRHSRHLIKPPGLRPDQVEHHPEQGCFTRTIIANQANTFAFLYKIPVINIPTKTL